MTLAGVPGPIWMIGCGNMGGAMLRRWLAAGLDPAQVTVVTRSSAAVADGVRVLGAISPGETPDTIVLAVKPEQLDAVALQLAAARSRLLISILAGVDVETLGKRIPAETVVRAMPNLPVAIGQGVTALHARDIDAGTRATVLALMAPLGMVEWITHETQFDAVTALAGCGPGFLFRFIDAMASAGEALGVSPAQAQRLAVATVAGAGAMAEQADASPATLADRVASPGGSTREGLNVLDRDDALVRLMTETLAAAAKRNREMAQAARG